MSFIIQKGDRSYFKASENFSEPFPFCMLPLELPLVRFQCPHPCADQEFDPRASRHRYVWICLLQMMFEVGGDSIWAEAVA